MRRTIRVLLAAVTATSAVLLTTTAASASEYPVQAEGQSRGFGGADDDGLRVYACDTFGDNWGVRTHYTYRNSTGGTATRTVSDANGVTAGCGEQNMAVSAPALSYQVCTGRAGADTVCGPWFNL
ncbi:MULTISPECIES: hypothetical protein [unclassified Streptomyces]|uniref:hypothetical protein n=1 Tax=unclassified Streptomyces TaxID=2593676 RepID=UPI002DD928A3|nr:hypothetical protein [Streptomyces sp. NBC_01237]WRZ70321.1 hypothetical protein OG251_01065 [Streptomyces sp. NBC_01237]